jgi:hypothetical protein
MRVNGSKSPDASHAAGRRSREDLMAGAEWELKAFSRAVHELFGPEEALKAVGDWLEELEAMDWQSRAGAAPDWRRITVAASARMAARVNSAARVQKAS